MAVGTMVGVIGTIAKCAGPTFGGRSLPHLLMHGPPRNLSMLSLQTATPSLAASAANIRFHFTFNLENFELRADTTYDLDLYAVRSDRVSRRRLLPPDYPFIRIMYESYRPYS